MDENYFSKLISRVALIGSVEGDKEEIKLNKSLLAVSTVPFLFAGAAWGVMYILFGEIRSGLIPLSYTLFSLASIIHFGVTGRFKAFRFSQLLLILLLPFSLMFSLGGFVDGSVVIIWSIICPLGALLFDEPSKAPGWLIAFILLVIGSVFIQQFCPGENHLSGWQVQMFFVINICAVGSCIFLMFYYFVSRKNYFQAQSESLLRNILPARIAEELKAKGRAEPTHFDSVTVLFADFKDFTRIAERLSAAELVAEIDTCFRAFDHVLDRYPVEKIKTIGDSYMCAGGLPVANHTHAVDVIKAALEIQHFMLHYAEARKLQGKESFEVRIGIHSGPVVAGIVGDKKFAYDIWGDTVNIASRMESSGEAGRINISGRTYELVKDEFNCSHRGKIEARNKGEIDMYFVEGLRVTTE